MGFSIVFIQLLWQDFGVRPIFNMKDFGVRPIFNIKDFGVRRKSRIFATKLTSYDKRNI